MSTPYTENTPLYNSRLIDTYVKYIETAYPLVSVSEILAYSNIKSYELADQGHWLTQTQVDRFYEKLVQLTGSEKIAREAGRYAASPDAMGIVRQHSLGLVGPANAFKLIGRTAPNLTKSAIYESQAIAPNKVRVEVTPRPGVNEQPFQCENRIGFWEALVMMLGNNMPTVEHPECIFKGDPKCTYIISWERPLSSTLKTLRLCLAAASAAALGFASFQAPDIALKLLAPSTLFGLTSLSFFIERREKNEILGNVSEIKDSSDQLLDQINRNYNNALMANEIGQAISSQTNFKHIEQTIGSISNIDEILKDVIQILNKRLDYDRGLILLTNQDRTALVFRAGYGYSEKHQDMLRSTSFHLDNPHSKGMFVVSFHKQEPFLINDISELESNLSSRSRALAEALGVHSFICCPIICDGEAIGILAVDNLRSKRSLVHSDLTLLMGIAPVIGISIRNADLQNARRKQFHSILQTLAKSIDARDPMTAGHSEKVTDYALGICQELQKSKEFCEMIRVASLLHDYGKIAVPDAILKKPGRLSIDEYQIVKTHSQKTREILDQINFEGIYCCVPEVAAAHHEKLDGSGYPNGLKGDQIPLGAKIIAVADFFEAITAKRHYREPMPLKVAFQVLREESGSHFEEEIIEALIRHFEKNHAQGFKERWKDLEIPERKSLRVPCKAPVSYMMDGTLVAGQSTDISARGIFVATERNVNEGEKIQILFTLPNINSEMYETCGRVAWVNNKAMPRKRGMPMGFGVEFLNLNKKAVDAVLSYVIANHLPTLANQPC
ncbi:MAG: HD domain-containing protein [Desulfuromonadaceae bacterium]|nr:HD domain-containing protein [Desulfuromonadaceae bacterium]